LKNAFQKVTTEGESDEEQELVDAFRFEKEVYDSSEDEVEMHSFKWDGY